MSAIVGNEDFMVQGNRVTCSDGRWWELQEDPTTVQPVGSVNDGAGMRYPVLAIAGHNGRLQGRAPLRLVRFHMTADLVLAWQIAGVASS